MASALIAWVQERDQLGTKLESQGFGGWAEQPDGLPTRRQEALMHFLSGWASPTLAWR